MTEERLNDWKHAFADRLRLAIEETSFFDYEFYVLGAKNFNSGKEWENLHQEKEEAFKIIFGESL